MAPDSKRFDPQKDPTFQQLKREQAQRQEAYRDLALSMYPHVCARCGRSFSGPRLRELTVHHIDGDHMNNPRDGSNWELLCLYCHDDAHGAYERTGRQRANTAYSDEDASKDSPFAGLKDRFLPKRKDRDAE